MHNTPEIRLPCPDDIKFEVVRRALAYYRRDHQVVDVDGARVSFPGGWGLVRASNTGPVLVLRCEADSPERLAANPRRSGESAARHQRRGATQAQTCKAL